jgi:ATP-dependent protease ClpP protease subunit
VTGNIYIYGEVGKQVTLDSVLKNIDPKYSDYIVHIHSPGGEVFEGYAIYNAIKNTGKNITVHVEGTCASIATLIAAAGDKIIMNLKSSWMIHSPRVRTEGTSKDLRNAAGQLDRIETQLIDSWVGRTSLTREQLVEMYDRETLLGPEEAVQLGFADEIQEVLKAVASADFKKYNTMENTSTIMAAIDRLTKTVTNLFKPKNMTDTLADGRQIMVESEDGDWTGKRVTLVDGTPLENGNYTLEGGRVISVADGAIATVTEPEAIQAPKPEDMELKEKLAAAEARIKELESAVQAQTDTATKAEAKAKSFENKLHTELKSVQDELNKIKNTTVGDDSAPAKATQEANRPAIVDPMAAWYKKNVLDTRNTD